MWNFFRSKPIIEDDEDNNNDNFLTAEDAKSLTIKNEFDYNNEYVIKNIGKEI